VYKRERRVDPPPGKKGCRRDFRRDGELSILIHQRFKNGLSRPTLTVATRQIENDEHGGQRGGMNADLAFSGGKRKTALCAGKPAKAGFNPVGSLNRLRMRGPSAVHPEGFFRSNKCNLASKITHLIMVVQHTTRIAREYFGDFLSCASRVFRAAGSKRCDTGFPENEEILIRHCDTGPDEVKHQPTCRPPLCEWFESRGRGPRSNWFRW
jgi:hypothetical protein